MKRGRILRLTSTHGDFPVTCVYRITCFSTKLLYSYTVTTSYANPTKNFKIIYDYKTMR
jgi:hypothetical protein